MYHIRKVANAEIEPEGHAFDIFRFITVNGEVRHARIDRRRSRNLKYVYHELLRHNAEFPGNESQAEELVRQAIARDYDRRLIYAAGLGWRPAGDGFVLNQEFLPAVPGVDVLFPPIWAEKYPDWHLHCSGTLKAWRREVATPAVCSRRLMLAFCAAFAAPMVRWVAPANIGVNLFGLHPQGRDVVARALGSIIGNEPSYDCLDWWVPATTLLGQARHRQDLPLVLGELPTSNLRLALAEQRERLSALQRGQCDKLRDRPTTPMGRWRGLFLSLLKQAHDELSRPDLAGIQSSYTVLDIPAARGGCGLIQRGPEARSDREHQARCGKRLWPVYQASNRYRGTAMRAYLNYVVRQRPAALSRVLGYQREYSRAFEPRNSQLVSRSREPWGLLYAAGRLAIDAGVLPWSPKQVRHAVAFCERLATQQVKKARLTPDKVWAVLQRRCVAPAVVARKPNSCFGPRQHAGFYELRSGERVYTISARAFRIWFENARRAAAALTCLHDAGLLLMGDKAAESPNSDSTDWAERTPRWPDGKVHRSIVLRMPALTAMAKAHREGGRVNNLDSHADPPRGSQ
jgi:hypothetical protein